MRALLLIRVPTGVSLTPEQRERIGPDSQAWVAELDARGARLLGGPVARGADVATVRMRDGELAVTDGPPAEDAEPITGFDVIECAGLTDAIEIAARHPVARFGAIEVRVLAESERALRPRRVSCAPRSRGGRWRCDRRGRSPPRCSRRARWSRDPPGRRRS
jgi:hypothetical protein